MRFTEEQIEQGKEILSHIIDRARDTEDIGIACAALEKLEKEEPMQELEDFLLGGPGHDGYAYQCELYCVDCGQDIIRDLYDEDYEKLESEDTDDSPQPIFFGESDISEYCASCGEYLYGDFEGREMLDQEDEESEEEDEE